MIHDPLCPLTSCSGLLCSGDGCGCQCDLIAKVRDNAIAAAVKRVKALTPAIRRSNDDGMGGSVNQAISRPETFTEYLSKAAIIAAIKGDSDE